MCFIIIINKGEKEISTPEEFTAHFGFGPAMDEGLKFDGWEKECLCGCDVAGALQENNIEYKKDAGDYYVGQLDQVKGD